MQYAYGRITADEQTKGTQKMLECRNIHNARHPIRR